MLAAYKGKIVACEKTKIKVSVLEDGLVSLIPLQPILMASYERGLNQPTLINCVHEALLSALIMVNIAQMNSAFGTKPSRARDRLHRRCFVDSKQTSLWSTLNDSKRQIFTTEKFQREINSASGARAFFQFYEQLHGTLHIQDMT